MQWRLEASGLSGANQIIIEPVSEGPHQGELVTIKVKPRNSEMPTLPFFPAGLVYVDRAGQKYTVLEAKVTEIGPDDGERSAWCYEYIAAYGVLQTMRYPS